MTQKGLTYRGPSQKEILVQEQGILPAKSKLSPNEVFGTHSTPVFRQEKPEAPECSEPYLTSALAKDDLNQYGVLPGDHVGGFRQEWRQRKLS
jgi:hypothetical protein